MQCGYNRIILFLVLLFNYSCQSTQESTETPISIDFWYGDHQLFGAQGVAQKWINILGNVQSEYPVDTTSYQLNHGPPVLFNLGSDLHRLATTGDFNVDLEVHSCLDGNNSLQVSVGDSLGNKVTRSMTFYLNKSNTWPLPYRIKWSEVKDLQEVVQVVDGKWKITEQGIQNEDMYYDRVIAFGDSSWRDYQVITSVIFHDFTPPVKGPPTYNVSHAAIASRWPGHDMDQLQPHRKWYPLGATAEFRLTNNLDSCRWRIFDGPKPGLENFHIEQPTEDYRSIQLGVKYGMKHRVVSLPQGKTRYSVKLWQFDQPEPENWDFSGVETSENISQGGALLIAHNTRVTFGDVEVISINSEE